MHEHKISVARSVGVIYTKDAQSIQFRMPAGFPGDVNRTHPVAIEPVTMDPTNPPTAYGQPGVIDATSKLFRRLGAGDTALTDVYGITVRPFPTQQQSTVNFGQAVIGGDAPTSINKVDVMRSGYIMVKLNNPTAQPSAKGGTVNIWIAASSGANVQGQFNASATGGSTIALPTPRCTFNGAPDADGNVEVIFHP